MAPNKLQKLTAQAIVQIFETGSVKGDYGQVTLLAGDSGHLTYGKAQTTLASGKLYFLIKRYCDEPEALLGEDLMPFLSQLLATDTALDTDNQFKSLLKDAGDDPVMQRVQDEFFDENFWQPALASAEYIGAKLPLSIAIIYDSRIHGSYYRIRAMVNENDGELKSIGEKKWMKAYVKRRHAWLAGHNNTLLQNTVYRMETFDKLIKSGRWKLKLPFTVRSREISKVSLGQAEPPSPRALDPEEVQRLLRLTDPYQEGDDVRELQLALSTASIDITVDAVFGPGTESAVIQFQNAKGLVADGIVGELTREALGLDT